jgi:hypothetical protein
MIFVGFLIGVIILAVAFVNFDKLLRVQYSRYKKQWEEYGKPSGFFWSPPESSFFSGSLQRTVRILSWTFRGEEWMQREPSTLRSVWIMRLSIMVFWLLWVVLMIYASQT